MTGITFVNARPPNISSSSAENRANAAAVHHFGCSFFPFPELKVVG
jgi:hypothetical protein